MLGRHCTGLAKRNLQRLLMQDFTAWMRPSCHPANSVKALTEELIVSDRMMMMMVVVMMLLHCALAKLRRSVL